MNERPILFSGPMVRAILEGRKTQTRRVVRGVEECPHGYDVVRGVEKVGGVLTLKLAGGATATCPYGVPGDRLWVRETWAIEQCGARVSLSPKAWPDGWPKERLQYVADLGEQHVWNKRPSIHMPRWACRLVLEVTAVRVERLQEIREAGAKAEGVSLLPGTPAGSTSGHIGAYCALWQSLNAKRAPWASNPWVWVVDFRRA